MRRNWDIAGLRGKGGRVRTVAIPVWVKEGTDASKAAAKIEKGPLLRSVNKIGKVGESLSDCAVWSVVTESAKQNGIERFGAQDLRRTVRSCAARLVVIWRRSSAYVVTGQSRRRSGCCERQT
jgi:integrase